MNVTNQVHPSGEQAKTFFGGEDDGPMCMVNLLKFKDKATYADGSVRFSPFSVDPLVWLYLCVIDDGQTVNTDE